jgi:hypothetical protein
MGYTMPFVAREPDGSRQDGTAVQGRLLVWLSSGTVLGLMLALTGCGKAPTLDLPGPPPDPLPEIGADFAPDRTGTIEGKVTWDGEQPLVPSFYAPLSPLSERQGTPKREWPNPNAPAIAAAGRLKGIGGAIVYLRGVDPRKGRPWDHPPVRIEQREYQIHVRQGEMDTHVGFVRRGAAVKMLSCDEAFYSLQARGAAFFTLLFLQPDQPRGRILDRAGLVELTSGAGQFWMRGYLFVCDHPYYTRTAADGSFRLSQVPPGDYEVVCWLPNWKPASRELDADTWQITKMTFLPPRERSRPVHVRPGQTHPMWFVLSD